MSMVTIEVLGGKTTYIDIEVGEEGISVSEIRQVLAEQLGPPWRYSTLLVDGRSVDYLGNQKIKVGEVVAALKQVQGACDGAEHDAYS